MNEYSRNVKVLSWTLLFSNPIARAAGSIVPRWLHCHDMEAASKSTATMLYREFPCLVMQQRLAHVICIALQDTRYFADKYKAEVQKCHILYIQDLRNGKQEATLLMQRVFTMNLNFCWRSCSELQFDLCPCLICLQNVMNLAWQLTFALCTCC